MKKIMMFYSFYHRICAAVLLFIKLHPVFGGNPSTEQKKLYQNFDNYADGKFVNQTPERWIWAESPAFSR